MGKPDVVVFIPRLNTVAGLSSGGCGDVVKETQLFLVVPFKVYNDFS